MTWTLDGERINRGGDGEGGLFLSLLNLSEWDLQGTLLYRFWALPLCTFVRPITEQQGEESGILGIHESWFWLCKIQSGIEPADWRRRASTRSTICHADRGTTPIFGVWFGSNLTEQSVNRVIASPVDLVFVPSYSNDIL